MNTKTLRNLIILIVIIMGLTACNVIANPTEEAALPTATVTVVLPTSIPATEVATLTVPATSAPSDTPPAPTALPSGTPVPATCTDAASFVADVTVPDGTIMASATDFNKTWRVKNTGTCTWTSAYSLVFTDGTLFTLSDSMALPSTVAPGQTTDLSMSMTSPIYPATYESDWKLRNPDGVFFGVGNSNSPLWVKIVVQDPQTNNHGSISGIAWQDQNGNNQVDAGETLPNVTITLATGPECTTILNSTTTNNIGGFTFANLAAGSYCLFGTDGTTTVSLSGLTLAQNQELDGIIVNWPPVFEQPTVITGFIYKDLNQNGVYDEGEPLVANREVWLMAGTACQVQANPVAAAFSGADGRYTLAGEFNGNYCIGLKGSAGLEDAFGITVTAGQLLDNIHLKTQTDG